MNSNGFSLIQVLFTSSVLGALTLLGIRMMKDQEQLANQTTQRFEIEYIVDDMRSILEKPENCQASFAGTKINGAQEKKGLTILFNDFHRNEEARILVYHVYSHSQRLYAQETLAIQSYQLISEEGEIALNIIFDRDNNPQNNRPLTKKIELEAQFDERNSLITCRAKKRAGATSNQWDQLSQSIPVKWITPINERKLQIGKGLSPARLMIEGSLRAKLESPTIDCPSENIGTLGYNENSDQFIFCSGQGIKELNQYQLPEAKESLVVINTETTNLSQEIFAKICTLTMLKTKSGQTKCLAAPKGMLKFSEIDLDFTETYWELSLAPSDASDKAECQFRCLR